MEKSTAVMDMTKYEGKYVALINGTVVGSGSNAKTVLDDARKKHPKEEIILMKVPEEETLIL